MFSQLISRSLLKVVIKWEQKEAGRAVRTAISGHDLIALSAPLHSNELFLTFYRASQLGVGSTLILVG
jgi:hypothetical protein